MEYTRVVEWVDISAPREDIFAIIVDIERRMQLSPLWGIAEIETPPANYPQVGSAYLVRHKAPKPEAEQEAADPISYQTVVTAYEPPRKLAYCLDVDQQTEATWTVQGIASGTRLTYTEQYIVDAAAADEFNTTVRGIIKNWLKNIKNYSELRESRLKRFARWVLDKFYLKMNPDQRKVVGIILVMHASGLIAFIMAAIAMGIASIFL